MSEDDMDPIDRDRMTKMEIEMIHLTLQVTKMSVQVEEMHNMLQQAKGAKIFIIGAAAIGGFASAKLASLAGMLGSFPK
jgi:predicted esterase YcpF (UPF0227 family)